MLILSSRWLAPLAEEGLLLDLTERVNSTFLQQFLPETVGVMRYDGSLYGIPESLEVLALFYNSELVADPPIDIQQLVQKVTTDIRLAMPVGFFWAYWGMDPFGGFSFDSDIGQIQKSEGLLDWLTTLQQIAMEAGIDFYFDARGGEDAFASEEAAYLVSGPWSLPRLRQELGSDRFRVVPLPSGPFMAGSPMLQTIGTVIQRRCQRSGNRHCTGLQSIFELTRQPGASDGNWRPCQRQRHRGSQRLSQDHRLPRTG